MMYTNSILLIAFLAGVKGFTVLPTSHSSKTALKLAQDESQVAINEALDASRKFGPQSKEARVAWDIVEEINASDNSVATKPALDDHAHVASNLLSGMHHQVHVFPATVEKIKLLKRNEIDLDLDGAEAHITDTHHMDTVLREAMAHAELVTDEYGATSTEARLAWETVEDILSNDNREAMKGSIVNEDEECLVELAQACEAMEELNKVLFHREVGQKEEMKWY